MPAPRFQLSPGLLQQLSSGGGFNPGQAMLQGLALGEERQQNAMTNQLNQKKIQLQEQKLANELKRLKNEADEEVRKRRAQEEMLQDIQSRADITEDAKKTFANLLRTEGSEAANDYLLSLDDIDEAVEEHRRKAEIDQQYKQDDKSQYQKGGTVYKDGKRVGRSVFDPERGHVWSDTKEPIGPEFDIVSKSITATSEDDAFSGSTAERPVSRDEHRQGLRNTSSQISTVSGALVNWDKAQDATGMTGALEENVSGVVKQLAGDTAAGAWRSLISADDPEAITKYRQDFKSLAAKNVPQFTGELGSRISDKELRISEIMSRVTDWKADKEQGRAALENILNYQTQIQEGHRLALGKEFRYDLTTREGKQNYLQEMVDRGVRLDKAIEFGKEMERWHNELLGAIE